jgi:hypothetical protein
MSFQAVIFRQGELYYLNIITPPPLNITITRMHIVHSVYEHTRNSVSNYYCFN